MRYWATRRAASRIFLGIGCPQAELGLSDSVWGGVLWRCFPMRIEKRVNLWQKLEFIKLSIGN